MPAYGHPENPYVLNHIIKLVYKCTCFHKYFRSKPYTSVWRKILEIRIKRITEIRHGMRELITFLWICGCWILTLETAHNAWTIWFPTNIFNFFEVKFAQILNDIGDMRCKLWKIMKLTLWSSWPKIWTRPHYRFQNSRVKDVKLKQGCKHSTRRTCSLRRSGGLY